MDVDAVFHRGAAQQSVVVLAVDIVGEDGTTIGAALGDVQRVPGMCSRSCRGMKERRSGEGVAQSGGSLCVSKEVIAVG
jgi:hypothetical protein